MIPIARRVILKKEHFARQDAVRNLVACAVAAVEIGNGQEEVESGIDFPRSPSVEPLDRKLTALLVLAEQKARYEKSAQHEEEMNTSGAIAQNIRNVRHPRSRYWLHDEMAHNHHQHGEEPQ